MVAVLHACCIVESQLPKYGMVAGRDTGDTKAMIDSNQEVRKSSGKP